jgi:hypothetical protein
MTMRRQGNSQIEHTASLGTSMHRGDGPWTRNGAVDVRVGSQVAVGTHPHLVSGSR